VCTRYINLREAEKKAFSEQMDQLPDDISGDMRQAMNELWDDTTPEAIVARDADILECMIQAKEYYDNGWQQANDFFEKAGTVLRTETAKKLAAELGEWDSRQWCSRLAKLDR